MSVKKKISIIQSNNPRKVWWIVGILLVIMTFGIYTYRHSTTPININEVGETDTISSEAFIPPTDCVKNKLGSLFFLGACDSHSFRWAYYRCKGKDQTVRIQEKNNVCHTLAEWQTLAEARCPDVCPNTSVAPKPSMVSSPTPPANCYYKPVKCIRPPCKPILVCPSPSPSPTSVVNGCIVPPPECVGPQANKPDRCLAQPGTVWCE